MDEPQSFFDGAVFGNMPKTKKGLNCAMKTHTYFDDVGPQWVGEITSAVIESWNKFSGLIGEKDVDNLSAYFVMLHPARCMFEVLA